MGVFKDHFLVEILHFQIIRGQVSERVKCRGIESKIRVQGVFKIGKISRESWVHSTVLKVVCRPMFFSLTSVDEIGTPPPIGGFYMPAVRSLVWVRGC